MSDDSFIREVNEELRQDQFKALWRRYGTLVIAAVVTILLAVSAYVGYQHWTAARAAQTGDAFVRASELAEAGNTEAALAALAELEEGGYGTYPVLARLRAAGVLAEAGDVEEAIARYDAVAADGAAPAAIRDVARLRAALLLVDHGTYADVAARVEPLTVEGHAMRHTAREALALAAWREGDRDNALALFDEIANDPGAPAGARQRAEMMADLIVGSGGESG